MANNRYGSLTGSKRIKDDYPVINTAFDKIQNEIDQNRNDIKRLDNLSFTGSEHDALVTASFVDVDGTDFGPNGNREYLNGRLDTWENRTKAVEARETTLENDLGSGISNSPIIGIGYNLVKSTAKVPVIPEINFTGISYVNLLGKDGDCEDLGKWTLATCTSVLDAANKVFGSNSIKATMTSTSGTIYQNIVSKLDATKYYLACGYIKNGDAAKGGLIRFSSNGAGAPVAVDSAYVTDSTQFVRKGVKIQPSDIGVGATVINFGMRFVGLNTQYAYFDGLMITEISATDYSLSVDDLMKKYPYGESYVCLTNPYFENRQYNLIRNGNGEEGIGYWQLSGGVTSFTVENGLFKLVTSSSSNVVQPLTMKQNTNYYVRGIQNGGQIIVQGSNDNFSTSFVSLYVSPTSGLVGGTFNSGNYPYYRVAQTSGGGANTVYFKEVMLIEDTIAPSSYKSCDLQRFVVEGQFTQDDVVTLKDGKVSGNLLWKHKTLFGKDYDWAFGNDDTGFKRIVMPNPIGAKSADSAIGNVMIKPDGKVLYENSSAGIDRFVIYNNGSTYLCVADTDSGWAEAVAPNNDEVKVFLNGWRAIWNNGTRYIGWASVFDNSVPSSAIVSTASGVNAAGQNKLNVTDGTKFANGSFIYLKFDDGNVYGYGVSSVAGNQLTLGSNLSAAASNNNSIALTDNYGTVSQNLLNWCKANVAPGYGGYQLHYKLVNPEPITDVNTHVHGDIWSVVPGDNYIDIECGMVLEEVESPYLFSTNYLINGTANPNRNKVEIIQNVYKNLIQDPLWTWNAGYNNVRGNGFVQIVQGSFDVNAIYTVDYQILKTLHAQSFTNFSLKYGQDVFTAISGIAKEVEAKQERNSALDTLVDLSVYETFMNSRFYGRATKNVGKHIITQTIQYINKRTIPVVKIAINFARHWDTNGSGISLPLIDVEVSIISVSTRQIGIMFAYKGNDATTISNLLNYGMDVGYSLTLDCRGRV